MVTSPATVELRLVAYSAGWVRLYGSVGLTDLTKVTMPAVPLRTPPALDSLIDELRQTKRPETL